MPVFASVVWAPAQLVSSTHFFWEVGKRGRERTEIVQSIDAYQAEPDAVSGHIQRPGDNEVLDIIVLGIDALEAHAVARAVHAIWFELQDLSAGSSLEKSMGMAPISAALERRVVDSSCASEERGGERSKRRGGPLALRHC